MLNYKIYYSTFKDQKAITLESSILKAQFMPHIGSKMVSLYYKKKGIELLEVSKNKTFKRASYDSDYNTKTEIGGVDEMFPSILECYYESYPWKGIKIPDHGELWSIPWEHCLECNKLTMEVHGVRFPYKLKKTVYFEKQNILKIDYELTNLSIFKFDFLWAAHPILYLEENSEIILPVGIEKIVNVASFSGRLGNYGEEKDWPIFKNKDNIIQLNYTRQRAVKDWEKYYIKGKMPCGWCAVRYPKANIILALSFPISKVPYLAILLNEGGIQDLYNIFFEPCTATFDRLDIAKSRGEYSSIEPNSKINWHLNFIVSENKDFKYIDTENNLI